MWRLKRMGKQIKKKGQSFSADILVVVIIILFGVLFLVLNKINQENEGNVNELYEEAAVESKIIYDELKSDNIVDSENKVDVDRLLALSHDELKEELGIQNDFAIVFEKDGKLVKIDPENDVNCIGSSEIIVNDVACTE